ncbi:hypothetical protein, partial [Halorubrum sp. Atlit-8R]|uniref:hypothetical protein n=1 Tax=Halorubrum sp. Atlit-8R TaxID=2282126 RepID=UPI001F3CD18F
VRVVEPVKLVAEALAETRRIIKSHTPVFESSYKNSHVGKRFLINDETHKNPNQKPPKSVGSITSNQGVSA